MSGLVRRGKGRGINSVNAQTVSAIPITVNHEVRMAWGELLSRYAWTWFATLTYRRDRGVGPESAVRNFKGWLHGCLQGEAVHQGLAVSAQDGQVSGPFANAWRAGKRWSRPVWVLGLEPHQDGTTHMHAVIRLPAKLAGASRRQAWRAWFDRYGLNRIEPPRSPEDVARYVAKYVTKGGEVVLSETFDAPRLSVV